MKQKKDKILIAIIIILALIVRLVYIIKIPYTEKQHDIEPNGNGLSYIFTIYETGHLPEDNNGQHYHPPLHHGICAAWVAIISLFNNDITFVCESLQFLTLIYSMLLLIVMHKIFKELKFSDKTNIILMFILAFHPMLIILSGSINNDSLCTLLMMYAILQLIKYYKSDSIKNIFLLAVITGLAVMAKTSGAIIAIPILYVFLTKLYKELKDSNKKKIVIKKYFYMFVFFGCISLPIGLWYAVRNYILFDQPILYILDIHNADLYVGNHTILQRILPFSNEIKAIYCDPWTNYNIPIFLLKCSLFEEYSWKIGGLYNIFYYITIILNIFFIIYILYCIQKMLIRNAKSPNNIWIIALFLLFIFNIFSYITMNLKLPYGCSMNFRYIISTLFIGIIFIGFEFIDIEKESYKNILYYVLFILVAIMLLFSNILILS